ncbi:hypothetical protein SeMB42_g00286 [Synchytrium endobioticum]|uniref:Calponin-homology (CH) domain-containing protein n=1 Tax=Synchytrium endobioticum TaxID=286115 RepID=A0A507DI80_9FUNG|nr:hypothetical protein SeLEV6574_g00409 [Synchytrium endobioticum]TPX54435.1 hypothetical protein SeMB42_g00286 [Synchytrium endobioticum]
MPLLYGLDRELAAKAEAKFDPQRERQAMQWIQDVTGEKLSGSFQDSLKDGLILCQLIQKLTPLAANIKCKKSPMPFMQMENINNFLSACSKLGIPAQELFMTIDLYEGKNLPQVIDCMFSLSRHATSKGYQGPLVGPKLNHQHRVEFTEEQLNAGKNIIGFQAGYNGGANQSGISFGATRQIVNHNAATPVDQSTIPFQAGFAGGANQSGMSFGATRQLVTKDLSKQIDQSVIPLQAGFTGGANASGVVYGARREIGGRDVQSKYHV